MSGQKFSFFDLTMKIILFFVKHLFQNRIRQRLKYSSFAMQSRETMFFFFTNICIRVMNVPFEAELFSNVL